MAKRIVLRRRARQDVDDAVDFYIREAGVEIAHRFVDAVDSAYARIRRHPETGSLRYAEMASKDGLRGRTLKRFPYVVLYIISGERVEIVRVLHMSRDIPVSLRD